MTAQTPPNGPQKAISSKGPRSLKVRSKGTGHPLQRAPGQGTSYRQRKARRDWIAAYRRRHPGAAVDLAFVRFVESLHRVCVECGDPFTPKRPTRARFCSDKCRARHGRAEVSR